MGKQKKQKKQQKETVHSGQQQERLKKKKFFSLLAFALIFVGAGLMVYSASFYEQAPNLYQLLQTICYFLVCIGGVSFALSAKYEADKQQQVRIQMMGLVFMIIAGGRLLVSFFQAMF